MITSTFPTLPAYTRFQPRPSVSVNSLERLSPAVVQPSKYRPADILIVVAHPDDDFYVAGTAAKYARMGYRVQFVHVTSGDKGSNIYPERPFPEGYDMTRYREACLKNALLSLGIERDPILLHFPDKYVKESQTQLYDALVEIVRDTNPSLVLTFGPDGMSGHVDHIATGRVTQQVVRDLGKEEQLYHMTLSRKSIKKYHPVFAPRNLLVKKPLSRTDVQINISEHKAQKIAALRQYDRSFYDAEIQQYAQWVHAYPYELFARQANFSRYF